MRVCNIQYVQNQRFEGPERTRSGIDQVLCPVLVKLRQMGCLACCGCRNRDQKMHRDIKDTKGATERQTAAIQQMSIRAIMYFRSHHETS